MNVVKNEKVLSEAIIYDILYSDGMTMCQCSSCRTIVDDGDNYCRRCGAKFVNKKLINSNEFYKLLGEKLII